MAETDPLRAQLLSIADDVLQQGGHAFSKAGRDRLEALVDAALDRLEREGVPDDLPKAAAALEQIVRQAATVHDSMVTIEPDAGIGVAEIDGALQWICPLPPFC